MKFETNPEHSFTRMHNYDYNLEIEIKLTDIKLL